MMEKEFGKLSTEQFIDFYQIVYRFFQEFVAETQEFEPVELAPDQYMPRWFRLYESTLNQVVASLAHLLLIDSEIIESASSEDPQQYVIDLLKSDYESPLQIQELDTEKLGNIVAHLICLIMHGICIAAYRVDINKLLDEGLKGHKESFLKAVNIDPCVLNTEIASKILAKAVIEDNASFFQDLSKAVKGSYPKGASVKYPLLNFCVYIIEDAAGEEFIDKDELHKLFTEHIALYPDVTQAEDSFGSFSRQLRRMKHKVKDKKS